MTASPGRHHALIASLGLIAHPEGGYYREVYRSPASVNPSDRRGPRSALTTIYFLLTQGQFSRWHRVQSDEVWHFYEGATLDLWLTSPEISQVEHHRLGPPEGGQHPVLVVPAGWWQAARSSGAYTLTGCTVGPGFEFEDFALAADESASAEAFRRLGGQTAELL
ncbi:MAG: cupin domain-containing protein [Gemmatimonadales bacterium]